MYPRFLQISVVLCGWLVIALSAVGWGQNLLTNPSFEMLAANGVPASWTREYNPTLTGPFAIVADAHTGTRAVSMMTQEWNYLRPQYLTQEVPLPLGTKTCRLSAYCKGQGFVNLVFQFRKGGQPLQTENFNMGFGPQTAPKELRIAYGLEQDYQNCETIAPVPDGADAVPRDASLDDPLEILRCRPVDDENEIVRG